jgi:hypothetical protein
VVAHFVTVSVIQCTRAEPEPEPVPEEVHQSSQDAPSDVNLASDVSAVPILENLISVSREFLSDGPPLSPGTVRSLRMVETHLTAVIQNSRASQSPLPDKESIPPNQLGWTETAEQMGAKQWKRPHPTNTSPAAPATEQIENLNQKQAHMKNTDSYSGGLWSGKDAAPDAQTAAQNTDARTRTPMTDATRPLPTNGAASTLVPPLVTSTTDVCLT